MSTFKDIKIEFTWNEELAKKSFDEIYKYEFNNSAKKYIGWFFIALLQFGVVAALKKGDITLLAFSTFMLIYWYYIKKIIAKKRFLKLNSKPKNVKIIANKDGLHFINENISWKWDEIEDIKKLDNGLIIVKYPNHYFIPNSGFKSIEDRSSFLSFYNKK